MWVRVTVRQRAAGSALVASALVACTGAQPASAPTSSAGPRGSGVEHSSPLGYSVMYPEAWSSWTPAGSDLPDQDLSVGPGKNPLDSPLWFTVGVRPVAHVENRYGSCSRYRLNESKYEHAGHREIGGIVADEYFFRTPPGYPATPGLDRVFTVRSGINCYRFSFAARTRRAWLSHQDEANTILRSVRFH